MLSVLHEHNDAGSTFINRKYLDIFNDPDKTKALAQEILTKGYVQLPEFLAEDIFAQLKALGESRRIINKKNEQLKGTLAHDLAYSDEIFSMCKALHNARRDIEGKTPMPLERSRQVVGFPYKDARGGARTVETDYHFDGAYINLVLPIMLPPRGQHTRPDVELFPNLRKRFAPYVLSASIARLLRHFIWFRDWFGSTKVHYEVGTIIIFFGDLTFHGVPSILEGERLVMTVNSHW
jgi:hypothetical protein